MPGVAPAVHEDDGHAAQTVIEVALEFSPQRDFIERDQSFALRADALVGLDHRAVQQFGRHDLAIEQTWTVLVGNAQRIAKAACRHQQGGLALALKQGIGGHRGAHLHALDLIGWHRRVGCDPQQMADTRDCSITVLPGVFRQQLVGQQGTVGAPRHDVGKGAAAVDPELPACDVGITVFHGRDCGAPLSGTASGAHQDRIQRSGVNAATSGRDAPSIKAASQCPVPALVENPMCWWPKASHKPS